ncbi:unnamed protein product [Medioppia subpectinata]|uniref:Uncharacterized protein n=1 Tax=Medioppia subpectinata TaxID=1979941 RepID=A0A7R9PZW8_9ACAR|nr:unnamed protein product [Medioppia subpectinata]CAG2107427.1 unnamed protein product [Medioppia subpectinata]
MPQNKHLNYYGFLGLFVALASVASFFILKNKDCTILTGDDYPKLEIIQITGTITGSVLFLLSFFNIAGILYDIKILFFAAIVAILIISGVMFWGAFVAFSEPCTSFLGLGINSSVFEKNAFKAEDGHNIAIMVLDVLAGLMLSSIGFTFGKRL